MRSPHSTSTYLAPRQPISPLRTAYLSAPALPAKAFTNIAQRWFGETESHISNIARQAFDYVSKNYPAATMADKLRFARSIVDFLNTTITKDMYEALRKDMIEKSRKMVMEDWFSPEQEVRNHLKPLAQMFSPPYNKIKPNLFGHLLESLNTEELNEYIEHLIGAAAKETFSH